MIKDIKIKDLNNIPLSRTTTNNIEIPIPVKVIYKIYKPRDIIIGDFENSSFVISNDTICEIVNRGDNEDIERRKVSIRILHTKFISGCSYFLAEGKSINKLLKTY